MNKPFLTALLLLASSPAFSATYIISGGNWDSYTVWNTGATGVTQSYVYDNGDAAPLALLAGDPGIVNWTPALPAFDGTYSGTITTDGSGVVTGGVLTVTGTIGWQLISGYPDNEYSWWVHSYQNLILNFNTMTPSVTGYVCHQTELAPGPCGAIYIDVSANEMFGLTAGDEGLGGAARHAAVFDGTELSIFADGWSAPGPGSDWSNTFTLDAAVVPIPAAAWLFGSALVGLGWMRRASRKH